MDDNPYERTVHLETVNILQKYTVNVKHTDTYNITLTMKDLSSYKIIMHMANNLSPFLYMYIHTHLSVGPLIPKAEQDHMTQGISGSKRQPVR